MRLAFFKRMPRKHERDLMESLSGKKIGVYLKLWVLLLLSMTVSACEKPSSLARDASAEIGTRILIKRGTRDYVAEVTDVRGPLVSMALEWQDQLLERDYYRGLYPVAGFEGGQHFELEYDQEAMEAFFPLKIDQRLSMEGQLHLRESGERLAAHIKMRVTGMRDMNIGGVLYPSFIVSINTVYNLGGEERRIANRVYYSPELSLILKSITYDKGAENFWRVVGFERGNIPRKRRSMTVAI